MWLPFYSLVVRIVWTETDGRRTSDAGGGVGCDDAHGESKSAHECKGEIDMDNEEKITPTWTTRGESVIRRPNVVQTAHTVGGAPDRDER